MMISHTVLMENKRLLFGWNFIVSSLRLFRFSIQTSMGNQGTFRY